MPLLSGYLAWKVLLNNLKVPNGLDKPEVRDFANWLPRSIELKSR